MLDILDWTFVGAISEEIAEDEARVNKYDPQYNGDENKYEYDGFSVYEVSLDDVEDRVSKLETNITLSLLEEQVEEEEELDKPAFVSLKEVNNLVNKKRELPLRPFEKYIQDLVSGKKTLEDGLD